MMDMPDRRLSLCVAVTAHRDLVASEVPAIESRLERLFQDLAAEFPDLPLLLLTPLAAGGDQLAARVAQRLGIPFAAVLPMEQSEYEKDFVDAGSLSAFRSLLDQAAWVTCLPGVSGAAPPHDDANRAIQYAQLGVFLSNHCQILLALWDGRAGDRLGGTGQVVRYHLTAVMPGFEADAFPASLLAENENDLHPGCSRSMRAGSAAGTAGHAATTCLPHTGCCCIACRVLPATGAASRHRSPGTLPACSPAGRSSNRSSGPSSSIAFFKRQTVWPCTISGAFTAV
jgi:hypothetical protein